MTEGRLVRGEKILFGGLDDTYSHKMKIFPNSCPKNYESCIKREKGQKLTCLHYENHSESEENKVVIECEIPNSVDYIIGE